MMEENKAKNTESAKELAYIDTAKPISDTPAKSLSERELIPPPNNKIVENEIKITSPNRDSILHCGPEKSADIAKTSSEIKTNNSLPKANIMNDGMSSNNGVAVV